MFRVSGFGLGCAYTCQVPFTVPTCSEGGYAKSLFKVPRGRPGGV